MTLQAEKENPERRYAQTPTSQHRPCLQISIKTPHGVQITMFTMLYCSDTVLYKLALLEMISFNFCIKAAAVPLLSSCQ